MINRRNNYDRWAEILKITDKPQTQNYIIHKTSSNFKTISRDLEFLKDRRFVSEEERRYIRTNKGLKFLEEIYFMRKALKKEIDIQLEILFNKNKT